MVSRGRNTEMNIKQRKTDQRSLCLQKKKTKIQPVTTVHKTSTTIPDVQHKAQIQKHHFNSEKKKPEIVLTKIPHNSAEQKTYTQLKIEELTSNHIIRKSERKGDVCVLFNNNHNVSSCSKLRDQSYREQNFSYQKCYVCWENHELVNCQLIQLANII